MPYTPPGGAWVALRLVTSSPPAGQFVGLNLGVEPDPPDPPPTRTAPNLWAGPGMPWAAIDTPHRVLVGIPLMQGAPRLTHVALAMTEPPRVDAVIASSWAQITRRQRGDGVLFQQLQRESAVVASPWLNVPRVARSTVALWQQLQRYERELSSDYLHPPRRTVDTRVGFVTLPRQSREWQLPYAQGQQRRRDTRIPWGDAKRIAWVVEPPDPDIETPTPPQRSGRFVALNLACPVHTGGGAQVPLLLGRVTCAHLYPRKRVYHVLNSAAVVRLPDRAVINAKSVALSIDTAQFAWSINIELLDAASFELLRPTTSGPREIEVTINGYVWTGVIDGFDEGAGWLANTWRVQGRSRAAYLAEPYAPVRSRVVTLERTAQQLAAIELELTDWTLDWAALDWLVPAGVHTFDGLTPIAAIQRIAAAVGAFVHADRVDDVLHVRPIYPHAPWDWAEETVDMVLLPDYTISRAGRYEGGERPEQAIVRGERAGVQARVLRAGTAGTYSAGVIVDPLITENPAARARGIYEMAKVGPRQLVDLEMPLFPSGGSTPGLVEPGALVLCDGPSPYRAITSACRITAQRNGAQLTVRQAISAERHYDFP